MPSIPFEAELRKIAGGQVIIKSLQRLTENLQAVPFRVGANFIRSGVGSPEGVEDGQIGDLYLRYDGSADGTETRVGVAIAGSEGLGNLNAPTLYTKTRQNGFTTGWAPVGAWMTIQSAETGTLNDWAPEAQTLFGNVIVQWSGASALTITGIPKGYQGQVLVIQNISSGQLLTLTHLDTSSAYGNQFTNRITSGVTEVAQDGFVVYLYRTDSWVLMDHDQGNWIDRAFSAGDYTGNGSMTWTVASGDVAVARYHVRIKTLTYTTLLNTTTVGGTLNTQLRIALPNGWTAASINRGTMAATDNGTVTAAVSATIAAGLRMLVFRDISAPNWAASTDNTTIAGTIALELT